MTGSTRKLSVRDEQGQGLVEYALILALVSLAAIVALTFLSGKINDLFSKAGNSLNTVSVASGGGTGTGTGTGGPAVPTGGNIVVNCSGGNESGCDDGDNMDAVTNSWTSGTAILGYTWTWEQNAGTCAAPSGGWFNTDNDGAPNDPDPTQSWSAGPSDASGATDAVRITVVATNAAGNSAPFVLCFDMLD